MKRWFLGTLAAALALLLLAGSFVFAEDPFYYYRWDGSGRGVFFNQRYQNAGIARNGRADTVLLGTSMVSNFRASYVADAFGGTAEKLTFPDGYFSEFDEVIDTIYAHGSPKRLLFSLDLNILTRDESAKVSEMPDYLYDENPFNDVRYLLNKDALFYSAYCLYCRAAGKTVPCDDAFTWDQDTGFSTNFVLASYTRPEKAAEALPADAYARHVQSNLAYLLKWANAHPETEFLVYLPPYNILFWDKTAANGATEATRAALRQCFDTLCGAAPNLRVYQFLDLPMVKDCSYYNDYIHFSGLGAQRVLEAMRAGGYEVTADNAAETLTAIRQFVQDFDYDALLAKKGA